MVTLIIGEEEERLMAHKLILCLGSEFFKAAFNGSFKEGLTSTLALPEEEPRIVKFIILWMYRIIDNPLFPDEEGWPVEDLLKLFSLAEKWIIDKLKQESYRLIVERVGELDDLEQCYRAWMTVRDSDIRYLVIGRYIVIMGDKAENDKTAVSRILLQ